MANITEEELMAEYGDNEVEALKKQYERLWRENRKLKEELASYKDKSELDKLKDKLKKTEKENEYYKYRTVELYNRKSDLLKGVTLMRKQLKELGYRVHRKNNGERFEFEIIGPKDNGLNKDEIAFLRELMAKSKEE